MGPHHQPHHRFRAPHLAIDDVLSLWYLKLSPPPSSFVPHLYRKSHIYFRIESAAVRSQNFFFMYKNCALLEARSPSEETSQPSFPQGHHAHSAPRPFTHTGNGISLDWGGGGQILSSCRARAVQVFSLGWLSKFHRSPRKKEKRGSLYKYSSIEGVDLL